MTLRTIGLATSDHFDGPCDHRSGHHVHFDGREDHQSAQSEVHFQMVLKYSFDPIRPRFGHIQTRFGQIQLFKFEGPKQYLRGHGVPRDGRKDHRSGH